MMRLVIGLGVVLATGLGILSAGDTKDIADAAELEILGYSADGKFLAYETYGLLEGGPVFWSKVVLIDVVNNSWAAPPAQWIADDEQVALGMVRDSVLSLANKMLSAHNIVRDNVGRRYVYHMFTDTGVDPHNVSFYTGEKLTGGSFVDYHLTLSESDDGPCDGGLQKRKIKLVITNKSSGVETVLQDDSTVPDSRGCALSYRIQEVHIYNNYVSVFVNVMSPGWEGLNMRFMAVTGELPSNDQ